MIRQYYPQRFRRALVSAGNVVKEVHVGTVPVGEIVTLSPRICRSRHQQRAIVEAWLPREIGAGRRDHNGRWANSYVANGGHLAQVRILSTGERRLIGDAWLVEAF